jgi:hypothetical protein
MPRMSQQQELERIAGRSEGGKEKRDPDENGNRLALLCSRI